MQRQGSGAPFLEIELQQQVQVAAVSAEAHALTVAHDLVGLLVAHAYADMPMIPGAWQHRTASVHLRFVHRERSPPLKADLTSAYLGLVTAIFVRTPQKMVRGQPLQLLKNGDCFT